MTDPNPKQPEADEPQADPPRTNELVRVRLASGIETNLPRLVAEDNDDIEILDEPAQVAFGKPRTATRQDGRPVLPHTTVDAEATKKKAASTPAGGSKA